MRLSHKQLEFWGPLNTIIVLVFRYTLQKIFLEMTTAIHPLLVYIIPAFLYKLNPSDHYITTCIGVNVAKITASSSDNWIY
jgi:hypothetical protein